MTTLFQNNARLWMPRLGFAVLLLTFGELVSWYWAGEYSAVDWLAVIAIYVVTTAVVLDLLVRWYANIWVSVLLVGGIFGIIHSGLISLGLYQNLPISFVFFATGSQTIIFALAFGSFRYLYGTELSDRRVFYVLAPLTGFIAGIWTRWLPTLESVDLPVPTLDAMLPATVLALIGGALLLFFIPLPQEVQREDWLLTPVEWTFCVIALLVVTVLRYDRGDISTTGLIISLIVLGMLILLLWFAQTSNRQLFYLKVQPDQQRIIQWIIMVIPFGLTVWLGYELPGNDDNSIQSTILFIMIALFGALWLPLISFWVSIRAFTELGRQEY